MNKLKSRGALALIVVSALLGVHAQTALAGPSDDPSGPGSADRSSVVVADAQRHSGRSVTQPLVPTAKGLTALVTDQRKASTRITSELPRQSGGSIVTTSTVADMPAQRVGLGFPKEASGARTAKVAANGTVVYADPAGVVDVAAQTDRQGAVRIHTILRTPDAPKAYTYPLSLPSGASAALAKDGSVRIAYRGLTAKGEAAEVKVGEIAPAWAVDANGGSVPTRYELDGKNLRQVVDTSSVTAWPVTADPEYWWGYQVTLTSGNANRLAAALAIGAGAAGIAVIVGTGSIVGIPVAVVAGIAAGLLGIAAAVVTFCNADGTGIRINQARLGGVVWCTSA